MRSNACFVSLACAIAVAAGAASIAHAQDAQAISKWLKAGKIEQANVAADAALAAHPQDAQIRFLKGVVLTQQGRKPDAIAVFTRLTEDFPELAEPWNNLAVLYAGDGQYDKARAALDMALKIQPKYPTAQENLGDVYVKLAAQAYEQAGALDATNPAVRRKLQLTRDVLAMRGATAPR